MQIKRTHANFIASAFHLLAEIRNTEKEFNSPCILGRSDRQMGDIGRRGRRRWRRQVVGPVQGAQQDGRARCRLRRREVLAEQLHGFRAVSGALAPAPRVKQL